jgi:hypothetical protein
MAGFDQYSRGYRFLKLERSEGILQMTVHTDGGPLQWGLEPQAEFARAFAEVGADRENRIIILTGTGNEFSGPRLDPDAKFFHGAKLTPAGIYHVFWNAQRLVHSLLDIEVPIIAAVNGPAKRHADLALMSDIVIAADDVTFEDTAHFQNGSIVPGDGINVVYTLLMGLNRARYLMLRMLERGGLPVIVDNLRQADDDNPNGYYEFEAVKRTKEDATWLDDSEGKVVKMVYKLLYDLPKDRSLRVVFMTRKIE